MLWPAFHFHSVLLIFVNLWPISTLCVADMVHAVADMVCGRYRRFQAAFRHPAGKKHHIFAPTAGAPCTIFLKLGMVIELVETIKKYAIIF